MLDALNSGERARVSAYVKKYQPRGGDGLVDHLLDLRRDSGGFELVRIEHAQRLAIDFVVDARSGPTTWLAHLEVSDGRPPQVVEVEREEIARGGSVARPSVTVDAATRARVVDGIARRILEWYVYPEVATTMADALRAHETLGDYDAITDGYKLARALNSTLHDVNRDSHLGVQCSAQKQPQDAPREPPPLDSEPALDEQWQKDLLRDNCGVRQVDRLEGNIGYLKLDFLGPPSVCAPTVSAAMNLVAHVDALIIDLRENGGGAPRMVAWLSSYLFDARAHLNDLYERKRNRTVEFWTRADVPGAKLGGKVPVYVLTAKRTFSGGEELTYDLKYLKRATIVGESTGGGAHPTAGLRVDDHFVVSVPFARAVNPITKTDWEGTGVAPDVDVPADQALEVAKKLAAAAIR
ncbi:MAG TPA: S41 family peptidase [Polyangia bacterium]